MLFLAEEKNDLQPVKKYRLLSDQAVFFILVMAFLFKPSPVAFLGPELGLKTADVTLFAAAALAIYARKSDIVLLNLNASLLIFFWLIIEVVFVLNGALDHRLTAGDVFEVARPIFSGIALIAGFAIWPIVREVRLFSAYLLLILFSIFSLLIFFDLFGFKGIAGYLYEVSKSRGVSAENVANVWRLSSTFTNPNYFGIFCSQISTSFLFVSLVSDSGKKKVACFFASVIFLSLMILAGSRTALLIFVTQTVFVFFFASMFFGRKASITSASWFFVAIAAVVWIALFFDLSRIPLWRFTNIENMSTSFGERVGMWGKVWVFVEKSPFIGVGSFKEQFQSLDNNYVTALVKGGVVGLFFLLVFPIRALILSFSLLMKSEYILARFRFLAVFAILATLAVMIGMISSSVLYFGQLSMAFFFCLGMLERVSKNNG